MLFTMNKLHIYCAICFLLIIQKGLSQNNSNNLSSSPYSLYGLGLSNEISTGKTNSLGKSGLAMPFNSSINNLNPASYGSIPLNSFLLDIGVKAEKESLSEDGKQETRFNANFSNVAIAFPISNNSGFGFTLIPFTNVGYVIQGIETGIEGSTETFLSNISGSGGLNDIKLNYGYSINEKLRFGLGASFLFGKIKEEETNFIDTEIININEDNFYNGFRLTTGFQYDLNNTLSLGGIVNLPTKLNGDQTKTVTSIGGFNLEETEIDIDTFKLPLEIGLGIHSKFNDQLFFNIDYKKSFWGATNQSDLIGDYVDQDFIGLGAEYTPRKNDLKYWKKINYRAGINFDSGNLSIDTNRINNFAFNLGLGLPIGARQNSRLNLGYSYGQKGLVSNGLIKENYHTLTLNFSLEDLWFVKRKYN